MRAYIKQYVDIYNAYDGMHLIFNSCLLIPERIKK